MSPARKIPDAEWELHKDEIKTKYLSPGITLDKVTKWMEERHGFYAR